MQARVENYALVNVFSSREQFTAFYKTEVENFKRVVRDAKIGLQE
jgi:tripartite-type tricarboxylate transporter receptor subunit TctC